MENYYSQLILRFKPLTFQSVFDLWRGKWPTYLQGYFFIQVDSMWFCQSLDKSPVNPDNAACYWCRKIKRFNSNVTFQQFATCLFLSTMQKYRNCSQQGLQVTLSNHLKTSETIKKHCCQSSIELGWQQAFLWKTTSEWELWMDLLFIFCGERAAAQHTSHSRVYLVV